MMTVFQKVRRSAGILCLLIGGLPGLLGIYFILGDLWASHQIRTGQMAPLVEGPGLGTGIGLGLLVLVTTPLCALGALLLMWPSAEPEAPKKDIQVSSTGAKPGALQKP